MRDVQTVEVLVGPPGCGKTTYARERIQNDPGVVVVCKDAIREMFLAGKYVYRDALEPMVKAIALESIAIAMHAGFDLIIDETHVTRAKRANLIEFVKGAAVKQLKLVAVEFQFGPICKARRMMDNRGLDPERWARVYDDMVATYEPVAYEEGWHEVLYHRLSQDVAVNPVVRDQRKYCNDRNLPMLMSDTGLCYKCHRDFTNEIIDKAAVAYITGCPLCGHSFC